jgi:hypothetical protein
MSVARADTASYTSCQSVKLHKFSTFGYMESLHAVSYYTRTAAVLARPMLKLRRGASSPPARPLQEGDLYPGRQSLGPPQNVAAVDSRPRLRL